jgi:RimJ/RimL family protein N-acetyltransferase
MFPYSYKALSSERYSELHLEFASIQPSEIECIRVWRNSQLGILRQNSEISPKEQKHYFRKEVFSECSKSHPRQILLSIRDSGRLVGYTALVHIDWSNQRAELSFLLDPQIEEGTARFLMIFGASVRLLKRLAFSELGLNRLTTETFAGRHTVVEALESQGFLEEGKLREHVLIEGLFEDSQIHGCLAKEQRSSIA